MSDTAPPAPVSVPPSAQAPGARVVRKRRINRWNEKRKQRFLAVLAETANVRRAAQHVRMSLPSAYDLKKRDAAFARAWREALETGYSELELTLLRQSVEGSERIERVEIGEARELKYVKTVRSYPFAIAVRLLLAHRDEVLAYREAEALRQDEDDVAARVRAHMDEVRARLLGQGDGGHDDAPGQEGRAPDDPAPDDAAPDDLAPDDPGWDAP